MVAKEAVATLKNNYQHGVNKTPLDDFRAFPIVFLYRHALELYMKAIIVVAAPMLQIKDMEPIDREKLFKLHSLDSLRQKLEKIFEAYEWDWNLGTPHFKSEDDFRKIISELHDVDKKADAFRYPLNTKGNALLVACFEFDLFEFCAILDSLFPILEGLAYDAHEVLQLEYESMSEFRNDI